MAANNPGANAGLLKKDSSAFAAIYCVAFSLFLVIAVLAQVLGWHWRSWLPGAESVESMTGGVNAAVYTFMSHIF